MLYLFDVCTPCVRLTVDVLCGVYIVVHSSRGDEVSAQEKAVLTGTASQTQRKVSGRKLIL